MNLIEKTTGLERDQIYGLLAAVVVLTIGLYGVAAFATWETLVKP